MEKAAGLNRMRNGARVLFLDTRGHGFANNLLHLRDRLLEARPDIEPRYMFMSESDTRSRIRRAEVSSACRASDCVICASDSLFPSILAPKKGQRLVLLLAPRLALLQEASLADLGLRGRYTDIVLTNGRFAEQLRATAPKRTVVRSLGHPVSDLFSSTDARAAAKERIARLCPAAQGRSIVVLSVQRSAKKVFAGTDLARFMDAFGESHYFISTAPGFSKLLAGFDGSAAQRVFDATGVLRPFDVLLAADTLVTTKFGDAVNHMAGGGQLHVLRTGDSPESLSELLPASSRGLVLGDISALPAALQGDYDDEAHRAFAEEFVEPTIPGATQRLIDAIFGE